MWPTLYITSLSDTSRGHVICGKGHTLLLLHLVWNDADIHWQMFCQTSLQNDSFQLQEHWLAVKSNASCATNWWTLLINKYVAISSRNAHWRIHSTGTGAFQRKKSLYATSTSLWQCLETLMNCKKKKKNPQEIIPDMMSAMAKHKKNLLPFF